jgi:uncharacterized integral membrane protein
VSGKIPADADNEHRQTILEPDMSGIRFVIGLLLGALLMMFALQNLQQTQVRMLFWYVDLPLVIIVFASAFIGALWASLWLMMSRWRRGRRVSEEEQAAALAATVSQDAPPPVPDD